MKQFLFRFYSKNLIRKISQFYLIKKHKNTLFKFSVTLIIFLNLYSFDDFSKVLTNISSINILLLLIGFFLTLILIFLSTLRWQFILKSFNVTQPFHLLFCFLWISLFFNTFLPAGIAGEGVRAWFLKERRVNLSIALSSIILDRILGLFVLINVILLNIPFMSKKVLIQFHAVAYLLYGLIVFFIVGLLIFKKLLLLKPLKEFQIFCTCYQIISTAQIILRSFKKIMWLSIIILFSWIIQMMICYLLALGLSIQVNNWFDFFRLLPLIFFIASIPISIGGWGIRESAMIVFLGYIGVSTTEALSLSVLYGSMMILSSLPGGIIWYLWPNKALSKKPVSGYADNFN